MNDKQPQGTIRYFRVPGWEVEVCVGDDVTAPEPFQFREELEIRLVTRGVAGVRLNGVQSFAGHGWLALIPPGQLHAVAARSPDRFSFFALRVRPGVLRHLKDSLPSAAGFRIEHSIIPADLELSSTVVAAQRVLANGSLAEDTRPLLSDAVREMVRWATKVEIECAEPQRSPAIDRALAHLRAHYAQDIPLNDLAAGAGLSKFHFLRLFSAEVGVTPHRYQLLLRMIQARALLRGGLEIVEVALRTGFCDQSHFTRCFHEIVGLTPGRYQLEIATPTLTRQRGRGPTSRKTRDPRVLTDHVPYATPWPIEARHHHRRSAREPTA